VIAQQKTNGWCLNLTTSPIGKSPPLTGISRLIISKRVAARRNSILKCKVWIRISIRKATKPSGSLFFLVQIVTNNVVPFSFSKLLQGFIL